SGRGRRSTACGGRSCPSSRRLAHRAWPSLWSRSSRLSSRRSAPSARCAARDAAPPGPCSRRAGSWPSLPSPACGAASRRRSPPAPRRARAGARPPMQRRSSGARSRAVSPSPPRAPSSGRHVALLLPLVLGADLWLNARHFWSYTEPYGRDALIDRLAATPPPYRVLDAGVYPGSALMAFDIPQVLGYHGNELRYYDELLGGKNEWRNLRALKLWDLLAVRYAIFPAGGPAGNSIPGFR